MTFVDNRNIVMPHSKPRAYWNSMIILLVVYTSLVLPVRTAFLWHDQDVNVAEGSTKLTGWTIVDLVIDFIFLFDVILNFNTGYIREPDFVSTLLPQPSISGRPTAGIPP